MKHGNNACKFKIYNLALKYIQNENKNVLITNAAMKPGQLLNQCASVGVQMRNHTHFLLCAL